MPNYTSSTDWNTLARESFGADDALIDEILNDKHRKSSRKGIPPPHSTQSKQTNNSEAFTRSKQQDYKNKSFISDDIKGLGDEDILSEDWESELKHDLVNVRQLNEELRVKLAETEELQASLKEKNEKELKEYKKKLKNKMQHENASLKQQLAEATSKIESLNAELKGLLLENESLKKDRIEKENHFINQVQPFKSFDLNSVKQKINLVGIDNIDDFIQERRYPGEKYERLYSNGMKLTLYVNGDLKQEFSNGQSILHKNHPNHLVRTPYDEITEVYQYPNGQVERFYASGKAEITYPDKTIKYKHPNGKIEIKYFDGTREIIEPNGEKKVSFPNNRSMFSSDAKFTFM